jgi:cytochrome c oxidase cbb3-type subunit III
MRAGCKQRVLEVVVTTNIQNDAARRTRRVRGRVFVAVAFWLPIASGCDLPGKPNPADQPTPPERMLKFSALFAENCSGCHGARGEFGPAPPLNSPLFRAIVSEADLERVIREGRKDTPMPAFARENGGTLSRAQIQVLVHEIKGTRYKIVDDSASSAPTIEEVSGASAVGGIMPSWAVSDSPPIGAPAYSMPNGKSSRASEEYEKIRKTTFARACAGCHGDHGQGAEKAGAIDDQSLLALASNQFLRRLVITGRADLGMPDYAGTHGRSSDFHPLDAGEVAELVELLGYWRQGGASAGGDTQQPKMADSVRGPAEKADQK